jgi:hypothetical protein
MLGYINELLGEVDELYCLSLAEIEGMDGDDKKFSAIIDNLLEVTISKLQTLKKGLADPVGVDQKEIPTKAVEPDTTTPSDEELGISKTDIKDADSVPVESKIPPRTTLI